MSKEIGAFKRLVNRYKRMSKKQLFVHIFLVLLALLSLAFIIFLAVSISDIHDFYLHHTESWSKGEPPIIDGVDYSGVLNQYPDKGPEAISWYLTAGDKTGGIYYILIIIIGFIALPTLIYTISFFLINMFPKKEKNDSNNDIDENDSKKSKRSKRKSNNKRKRGNK